MKKPWEYTKAQRLALRLYIARHWLKESDLSIGTTFGFTRAYVAKTRHRMGLVKSIQTRTDIKRANHVPSGKRSHKKMSDLERFERAQARKRKRNGESDSDLPMSESEHKAYMRSLGYEIE